VPVIKIKGWPLNCSLFDGEIAAGLVPTLFAADPTAAETALKADPTKAHYDINKLNKVLLMPETILTREALALLKKNR